MAGMVQIYPLQILIASLAGVMNRRQAEVLEYLIEENRAAVSADILQADERVLVGCAGRVRS